MTSFRPIRLCLGLAVLLLSAVASQAAWAQDASFDEPPIRYSASTPDDPVEQLRKRIDSGQVKLEFSQPGGYLRSLLEVLDIPVSSQTLVFSRTSFQRDRISPHRPRALYFNDDTYVGYVPGGDVLEIATTDPRLGSVFYTIDQRQDEAQQPLGSLRPAALLRQTDNCLQCHSGSMTRDVPGLIVRSVFPDSRGQPILSAGTFLTTQESELSRRWGGWYVTGAGPIGHMGNVVFEEAAEGDPRPGEAVEADVLAEQIGGSDYLAATSDIVALMVQEHQVEAHNRFTRAAYATARALRDEQVMRQALGETAAPGEHSDSTWRRIRSACDPLIEYLLFSKEAPLPAAIPADSAFAREFAARGPRDARGRSLRDFDLSTRLFKFPCSYLVYSNAFAGLPEAARQYIYQRLLAILTGADSSKSTAHLSAEDRQAILEILRDTLPDLPPEWKAR